MWFDIPNLLPSAHTLARIMALPANLRMDHCHMVYWCVAHWDMAHRRMAHGVRVHARGMPGAHGIRVHARGMPGAHGVRVHARGMPGAHGVMVHPSGASLWCIPLAHAPHDLPFLPETSCMRPRPHLQLAHDLGAQRLLSRLPPRGCCCCCCCCYRLLIFRHQCRRGAIMRIAAIAS